MIELGLTEDRLDVLSYLKDLGDYSAHSTRPILTRNEWDKFITDEDDEMSINSKKIELLNALQHFIPIKSPDEFWNIGDPVDKNKKIPTLKCDPIDRLASEIESVK